MSENRDKGLIVGKGSDSTMLSFTCTVLSMVKTTSIKDTTSVQRNVHSNSGFCLEIFAQYNVVADLCIVKLSKLESSFQKISETNQFWVFFDRKFKKLAEIEDVHKEFVTSQIVSLLLLFRCRSGWSSDTFCFAFSSGFWFLLWLWLLISPWWSFSIVRCKFW